jgi:hypothetical protein
MNAGTRPVTTQGVGCRDDHLVVVNAEQGIQIRIQAVSPISKALNLFVIWRASSQLNDKKQHHAVSLAICAAASTAVCRERYIQGRTR